MMDDDSSRNVIEVNLPRALTERLRALGSARGRSAASLIEESLEAYLSEPSGHLGAVVELSPATHAVLSHT